jgi:putative endopeptidase
MIPTIPPNGALRLHEFGSGGLKRRAAFLALPVLLAGCGSPQTPRETAVAAKPTARSTPSPEQSDMLAQNLDPATSPAVDFFQHANGGWIAKNPIPPSEASWTIGHLVMEQLYTIKRELNERAAKAGAPAGSELQKIGDFWAVAMDQAKVDADGAAPLKELLAKVDAIQSADDAVRVAAELQRSGVEAFWSFSISQDQKQSDLISLTLGQGGLGLPERDYYFNTEAGVAKARAEYPRHVGRMLKLLGQDEAAAVAAGDSVLQFETALATVSRTLEALRDPYANYNKMTVAELRAKQTPHIEWRAILDGYGLAGADSVIVGQPEFFAALDPLLQRTPIDQLRAYLRFHVASEFASFLGSALDKEHFAFYGTELQGAKEQRPRWKRVLDAQERAMGMVVGKVYVKDHFPEKSKQRYSDLVEAIRTTYREHIEALTWMSDATRAKALEKLAKMTKKVGFPDKWKDMSTLVVDRSSYMQNMERAARWEFDYDVRKFGKPVDRSEWEMTPQTYNAYYNPSNNEIVLPAAIFIIPGLADDAADDAVVYGYAAASTIGHEITHGFDDEGRQFDVNGNLADWWTEQDAAAFKERAEVMAKQFDGYEPIKGLHINGHATLGENIADLGGVVLGLDAFKKTEQYKEGGKIAGLTPLQRYFLGYALSWLGSQREEQLRQRLLSDVHSPAKWRVNGPVVNVPDFYTAFGIKKGDPMWRDDAVRVRIW